MSLPADPGSTYRICAGCGAQASGLWPEGWAIEAVYGPSWMFARGAPARIVTGERPYCPDCQQAGQAVSAS